MQKSKFMFWSAVASLGGFMLGFELTMISEIQTVISPFWRLHLFGYEWVICFELAGIVLGTISGGIASDKWGRKPVLYALSFLFILSSSGTALTLDRQVFLLFRLAGGWGIGVSSVIVPMYISEISPAGTRGRMVLLFQIAATLGILTTSFLNYFIINLLPGFQVLIPVVQLAVAALFSSLLRFIPESPRWLILKKEKVVEASEILRKIDLITYQKNVREIRKSVLFGKREKRYRGRLVYNIPVILVVLFVFFNQITGINSIAYFSPRILEKAGLGDEGLFLATFGTGMINLLFTLLAMGFIDRIGRKALMIIGSSGLIITLALVSYSFFRSQFDEWSVPFYLFICSGFFSFSQGSVIWVFISEIFPNHLRARGQILGCTTHWLMAAVTVVSFPFIMRNIGCSSIFLFYAIMMCIQLLFVWQIIPETKGLSLEQIGRSFQ